VARTTARLVRQTRTTALFRVVGTDGGTRGHLKVSGGALVWWPRSSKRVSYRQTWGGLAKSVTSPRTHWSKRRGRSDPR